MNNLLTDAEITQMRTDLEGLALPNTCNILTVTRTPDGQGGFTEAWGTAYEDIACRVDYRQGMEPLAGQAVRPYSFWQFTFPRATVLTAADRVEVGTVTYSISAVDAGNSWDACLRAEGAKL